MSSVATIAIDSLLPHLAQAIAALLERQTGSLERAWLVCRQYNEIVQSPDSANACPPLDLPLACFFPGHELPLAAVLEDARVRLGIFLEEDEERTN